MSYGLRVMSYGLAVISFFNLFPLQGVYEVLEVFAKEVVDGADGVFVRGGVEVEGTTEEVVNGIGNEKLVGGGGIAFEGKINAVDAAGGGKGLWLDGRGFIGVLFIGQRKCIVDQGVEVVSAYLFVTDVDAAVELRKVNVDPVRIFGRPLKKGSILHDLCIGRVFETIGIARLVERLVGFLWKIYFEKTPWLISILAVAGKQEQQQSEAQ